MAGFISKTIYQISNDTTADAIQIMMDAVGTTVDPSEEQYHKSGVELFAERYMKIHGYLSVFVCVFGIISNVINILVLTRKHMQSPTNYILTALATADMLTMTTYPIMAVYLYIISSPDCIESKHKKGWMYFIFFHNLFIVTCHNMATWCTIALGVFRYIFVCQHHLASRLCSMERARITIVLVVVGTLVVCIPNFFMYRVGDLGAENNQTSCYFILQSEYVKAHPAYEQFVRWLYGVVIKIIPCIVLTILSVRIIVAMQTAKKRRARLLHNVSRVLDHDHQMNEHNRTTIMLISVVTIFIVTEFPQGILAAISGIDSCFFQKVYVQLGDLMDLVVLIKSAVNFILYCIMSQQFRNTFKSIIMGRFMPSPLRKVKTKENGTKTYNMVSSAMVETTQV